MMTSPTPAVSAGLHCHRCRYDLRAHRDAAVCPECGATVAESERIAALPPRPTWAASDPRWRRRILAGLWLLALLPLPSLARYGGWGDAIPAPTIIRYNGAVWSLGDTFLANPWVCQPLLFCMGSVLLFSAERGRPPGRIGWPRRLGILCVWSTFVIAAAGVLFITALVLSGIGAMFLAMPGKEQFRITPWCVNVAWAYLRYGPQPKAIAGTVQVAFSHMVILFACVQLYDALRRVGRWRWVPAILLAPLALLAVVQLWQVVSNSISAGSSFNGSRASLYFRPESIARNFYPDPWGIQPPATPVELTTEYIKWSVITGIAVRLSVAQAIACSHRRRAQIASSAAPTSG